MSFSNIFIPNCYVRSWYSNPWLLPTCFTMCQVDLTVLFCSMLSWLSLSMCLEEGRRRRLLLLREMEQWTVELINLTKRRTSMQEDSVSSLSITLLIPVSIFNQSERFSSNVHPAVEKKTTSNLFLCILCSALMLDQELVNWATDSSKFKYKIHPDINFYN